MTPKKEGAPAKGADFATENDQSHHISRTNTRKVDNPCHLGEEILDSVIEILFGRVESRQSRIKIGAFSFGGFANGTLTIICPDGMPGEKLKKWIGEIIGDNNFPVKYLSFVEPPTGSNNELKSYERLVGGIVEEDQSKVTIVKRAWIWKPYIPAGRLTILAGDPGQGKSQITIDLISRVSRNETMPDGSIGISGNCAIITAEDHTAEDIKPRLVAAEAILTKIKVLREVIRDGQKRYLSFPRDLEFVEAYIRARRLRVLVLDPLSAFMGTSVNTYKDNEVREALKPLEYMAESSGCAILIVAHLNKKEDVASLYRVCGSVAFIAAARSVLAVSQDPKDISMHLMYSLKLNQGKKPPAMRYGIEEVKIEGGFETSRIEWQGHADHDPTNPGMAQGTQEKKDCLDFLKAMLFDGELPAREIKKAAADYGLGVSWKTLSKYKREFQCVTTKGRDGHWVWSKPQEGWPK